MATAVLNQSQESQTDEQLAARYVGDLIYRALIEAEAPLRASEIVRAVGRSDIDFKLVNVVLSTNQNLTAVDRKWTLWTRFLDTKHTVDTTIHRIFDTFGQPIRLPDFAREMAHVTGRPWEIWEDSLRRITANRRRFLVFGDAYVVPASWLLDTSFDDDAEVLYENFVDDEDSLAYVKQAEKAGLNWRDAATITAFLDLVGKPVKNKALQFLAWQRDKDHFDAGAFYARTYLECGAFPLSGGSWIGPKVIADIVALFPVLAEQEVSESAAIEAQEPAQPLVVGETELDQLVKLVLDSEGTILASRLLEEVFDVVPEYRTYEQDLQTVIRALAQDERVVWVGTERFRPQGTIPGYVFSVPGLLDIPTTNFLDAEGNPVDLMLEDDGFDGGLEREIVSPFAQDVLDEEPVPSPDPNPPSNARSVIKYHHKEIGTLPLCQFSSGFFPPTPNILETEFVLPGGLKAQVWVNNETRLLYGLLDWYQSIPIDSGATFTLERQAPDRYVVNYNEESEPTMFISRNRINELMALRERAEAEDLSTFEIMQVIMEHYRKGIEFITLLTELNVVRRATRRLAASILSEYHCFFQRGGSWVYDTKKLTQGFDKSKRKYLIKD